MNQDKSAFIENLLSKMTINAGNHSPYSAILTGRHPRGINIPY
jgi:hypothetical protein